MQIIRRAIFAFVLAAGLAPAFAQAPPPVPALPDTERRTSYSITGSNCSCSVGFALFGDSTDFNNWVEVWLNGVRLNFNDATFGWTITSPTGSLSTIPRPVTDAVLTFTNAQTGTVQIVGARRPRRVSQFSENRGVAARDLNQALTDMVAQNRETWDKINDVTGRSIIGLPGETIGQLPSATTRAGGFLTFDGSGNPTITTPSLGTGNVIGTGPTAVGDLAIFNNTAATSIGPFSAQAQNKVIATPNGSSGKPSLRSLVTADLPTLTAPLINYTAPGTGGQTITQQLVNQRWIFASDYGVVADGINTSIAVSTVNGGSTLTVATPLFSGNDCNGGTGCTGPVNKVIMVGGAGAAGAAYAGTITSFTSSTVVGVSGTFGATLTASAQSVVSGTDNSAKLQNWINRLQTTLSIGVLDPGAYAIATALNITNTVNIFGSGQQSDILLATPTMTGFSINTNNAVYFNNFWIFGSINATNGNAIFNTGSSANSGSVFSGIVVNGGFRGYFEGNVTQVIIDRAVFNSQNGVGIQTANANSCSAGNKWITNTTINTVVGSTAGLAITDSGVQFVHNKINGGVGAGAAGILVQPASTCVTPSDILIADSSIEGGQTTAIAMTKGSFAGTYLNVTINGVQTQGQTNGIIIGDGNTNWIKHVAINGGQIYAGPGGTAISLTNSVVDAAINGVALANIGGGSSTGIAISSTVTGSARGNVYDSSLTTPATNASPAFLLEQSINGHTDYVGVTPTAALATCGTTGSTALTGTDSSFTVTSGATATTSCLVTFAKAYSVAPRCTCTAGTGGNTCASVQTSTTQITINFTSGASQRFNLTCHGT